LARGYWTAGGRWLVFLLGSTSIACLLFDFYGICPMKLFTPFVFLPALAMLSALALFDRAQGDGQLWKAIVLGLGCGLLAAMTYDVFRLPFVFAKQWCIATIVPPLQLFKVFPRFGAMILGQPVEQTSYSISAKVLGWAYHFSNGATFGVMYVAVIGNPTRRHWAWAVVMALALELGMLLTPYPKVFHIPVNARFVAVTLAAHAVFGVGLGLATRYFARNSWAFLPRRSFRA